jgi:hypothetical protein
MGTAPWNVEGASIVGGRVAGMKSRGLGPFARGLRRREAQKRHSCAADDLKGVSREIFCARRGWPGA